jgi:hypothetical protein
MEELWFVFNWFNNVETTVNTTIYGNKVLEIGNEK